MPPVIDFLDVKAAAGRLIGHAVRTPLLRNAELDARAGGAVLIKHEGLQHSGSFKFRGAFNRLVALTPDQRRAGVVAWSSGNHAQGVACAAQRLGLKAAIVMPSDAPRVKVAGTRAFGAEVIFYDRATQSREAIATALADQRGAVLVPSYDDPHIIAGQGTVGLEIVEDAALVGLRPAHVLVCCGGGGLVAGIATAVKALAPESVVHSVEPDEFNDTARSLAAGERLPVENPSAASICDALLAPMPGALTFPINLRLLGLGLAVTDDEVKDAMRFAFRHLKIVLEPGGAVALAALLAGKLDCAGRCVAVVASGGNVDADLYANILQEPAR